MTTQARPVRAPAGSPAFLDIVNAAVPPRPGHDHSRPMCAAWDDHQHWTKTFTVSSLFMAPLNADGSVNRAANWTPIGYLSHNLDANDFEVDEP